MSRLQFIFVHGLSGWGSYDAAYQKMPYWGMRGGDLMPFLRKKALNAMLLPLRPPAAPGTVPVSCTRSLQVHARTTGKHTAGTTVIPAMAVTIPNAH